MSKRFGRNQRRKMRQELEFQQKAAEQYCRAYEMQRGVIAHNTKQVAELRRALAGIRDALGQDSRYLPPEMCDTITHSDFDGRRVVRIAPTGFDPIQMQHLPGDAPVLNSLTAIELMELVVEMREVDYGMRNEVHMLIDGPDKPHTIYYAIAKDTFRHAGPHDALFDQIARHVATYFREQVKRMREPKAITPPTPPPMQAPMPAQPEPSFSLQAALLIAERCRMEGRSAHLDGWSRSQCPYVAATHELEAASWLDGWGRSAQGRQ